MVNSIPTGWKLAGGLLAVVLLARCLGSDETVPDHLADPSSQVPAADAAAAPPPTAPAAAPQTAPRPPSYGPYEAAHGGGACTSDCSGHEAGYEWAEENGVVDEDDCEGDSESFAEGCMAYIADQG